MEDARNAYNGFAADALIVIGGGKGTLTEVAFGRLARRPVYFVGDTRAALARKINEMGAIAAEAARVFDRRDFENENLINAVTSLLNDPEHDVDLITAVELARSAECNGYLLDLPGNKEIREDYERALDDLAR